MDSTLPCMLMEGWSEKSDSEEDDNEEFEDEMIGSLVPSRRSLCGQLLQPISRVATFEVTASSPLPSPPLSPLPFPLPIPLP